MDWPAKPPAAARRRALGWRSIVGGTGRTFIASGLLLFGFVAYQLWGTGIQQARSQDRLDDRFAELLATSAGTSSSAAPTAPTTAADEPSPTVAPSGTTATPTVPATGRATRPTPREGEPIARIAIPSIGVEQVVVSGVGTDDLKKGPGHYPDTPLPGEVGNAAIAGHRSTFGAPFARVDELVVGDRIEVTTPDGRFVYTVTGSKVVESTEVSVIGPSDDAVLTLTSCWPKYSADKRIVIRAVLDPVAGLPALPAPPSTAPATTARPQPVAGGTTPTTVATATGSSPTTTAAELAGEEIAEPSASVDAFRQGWWSDEGAWGDVVLWGSLLAGVALGAWWLSRRTQRNWFGLAVGLVPFVVVLYFFYENAARLLPPNI